MRSSEHPPGMNPMTDVCVAYLVREKNGLDPFLRFLESYIENRGGMEHDLLIIYKGFGARISTADYEKSLVDIPHKTILVRDNGFDIIPYFIAAKTYAYRYFCFLNSFSLLLDADWLLKMHRCISRSGVGLVGATGSYQSVYYDYLYYLKHLGKSGERIPIHSRLAYSLRFEKLRLKILNHFYPSFPNVHLRTNGYMIPRDVMLKIRFGRIRFKSDAYRFESGRQSLTRQVMGMDYRVLVVGKDGIGYEKEDWCRSKTFWQDDQQNLLIADNQTRQYSEGDAETRKRLSRFAWGESPGET